MVRRRRLVALGILILVAAAISSMVAALAGGTSQPRAIADAVRHQKPRPVFAARPTEIRGVHVTMALAAVPGKIGSYLRLRNHGLNTLEVDVKDENGEVAFTNPSVPLARRIGAAQSYYDPYELARKVHAKHVYLIGRIVVFEDPILSEKMPSYALENPDGSVWHNSIGLGWTNMYDTRVWKYVTDLGLAAARAGFDEIQFDYLRFPSDGDVWNIHYPRRVNEKKGITIGRFAKYASRRLHRAGVRVGADLFGLAAERQPRHRTGSAQDRPLRRHDLAHGVSVPLHAGPVRHRRPRSLSRGPVVFNTLKDFRRSLRGRKAVLVPWLQDFSLGRDYTFEDVKAQVNAARNMSAAGFLLWNPEGVYTKNALRPRPAVLGREALDDPAPAVAPVAEPVVQAVLAVLPEFDDGRVEAVAAPVLRQRHVVAERRNRPPRRVPE